MASPTLELLTIPLRAMRRAVFWWGVGLTALVAVTIAFWPAFEGASGISEAIDSLPPAVVQAFGLGDFGTPVGFLRGNLYELLLPLLLALAGVTLAGGQTASAESSGRLELLLAQPVDRRMVYGWRFAAVVVVLGVLAGVLIVVQLGTDAAFGLTIGAGPVVGTIVLCALLGVLHAAIAFLVATVRPNPSLVLGVGVGIAIAGYLIAALFPLSDALSAWHVVSPWNWALGGEPLVNGAEPWRVVLLIVPSALLAGAGLILVARRDVAVP